MTGRIYGALLAVLLSRGLAAQEPYGLHQVAFLSGCWAGTTGTVELREQWTDADGGAMLGTTRFLREGRVVDWEFGRLSEEGGVVTLWPYPSGMASEHGFPLVRVEGGAYVFENLDHDFPVRIVYERVGEDELRPRIEGHDGTGPSWSLRRVTCPGA